MRTTLNLPEALISQAMQLTSAATKTAVITLALENLIRQQKAVDLMRYAGKVDLGIDLAAMRKSRV